MQIAEITAEPLEAELTEPFSIATGAQHSVKNVLVALRLSSGVVGLGEAAPFPAVSGETQRDAFEAVAVARPLVEGRDCRSWRTLSRELAEAVPDCPSARTALETAILDAMCRAA